ncbi:MAG: zinc carboxypeptidase, partial [Bacteroidetes bacterium]|nr:zinc carboxypeptidase [Bacteroidota bacterium]
MKKTTISLLLLLCSCGLSFSQFSPEKFLGYTVGTNFTRHDRVVAYFQALQNNFPNEVKTVSYGKTYEGRELLTVFIGAEETIKNLEEIKKNHALLDKENLSIVWLSYNVHGNESSGTEAAIETAYRLVTDKKEYLKNVLVIIDPCLNPDGRDRYVN